MKFQNCQPFITGKVITICDCIMTFHHKLMETSSSDEYIIPRKRSLTTKKAKHNKRKKKTPKKCGNEQQMTFREKSILSRRMDHSTPVSSKEVRLLSSNFGREVSLHFRHLITRSKSFNQMLV